MYRSTKKRYPFPVISCLALTVVVAFSSCQKSYTPAPDASSADASALAGARLANKTSAAVQTPHTGVLVSEHIHGFYEYLPKGYSNDLNTHPLLICLHGIGQVGNGTSDLPSLLNYGPAMLINNGTFPVSFTVDGHTYSMIVITPQFTQSGMLPLDIDSLIEYCKSHYRIDTSRVYLAGVSIGGANLWHYAGYSPAFAAKVTAMVPISAWTTPDLNYQVTSQEAQTIAAGGVKIWQTHCYNDPTAMFSWSVSQADMVDNFLSSSDLLPKLTSFNSNSHDAWTTTYDPKYKESGMNIYQWMLHYAKGVTSTPIPQKVPFTQVVTLKALSNNLYVHNNGDGSPLYANSSTFSLWEGFTVISTTGGGVKVALQNQNHYITCANASAVACTASAITPKETFSWVFNTDGTVSFTSNTGKYLSISSGGGITCLATTIGPNEKFLVNR